MNRNVPRFVLAIISLLTTNLVSQAADPTTSTLYDKDPSHPWNRLHAALLVRTPELEARINDLLDPPYWHDTTHLREGDSNMRAIARLKEFVKDASVDSQKPLARALMQRDLLGVFHWLVNRGGNGAESQWTVPEHELAQALADAIHLLALSKEEIQSLPDNYAAAVTAEGAVTTDNPAEPNPFLPLDLLTDDGPWLAIAPQGDDGLAATEHFQMFYGRSVFEVRMRHPDGRTAGEDYLKELAAFPQPFVDEKPTELTSVQLRGQWANPSTPQFPVGTAWALVRRAILCDTQGRPVASPLIESVQMRIYRNHGFFSQLEPDLAKELGVEPAQFYFGWEMHRSALLDDGGLRVTTPEDQFYADFPPRKNDPLIVERRQQVTLNCNACHNGKGIHSVASRMRLFDSQQGNDPLARPPEFLAVKRITLDWATIRHARNQPGWLLLQWLRQP